jgi:hypothetical protein
MSAAHYKLTEDNIWETNVHIVIFIQSFEPGKFHTKQEGTYITGFSWNLLIADSV